MHFLITIESSENYTKNYYLKKKKRPVCNRNNDLKTVLKIIINTFLFNR